MSDLRFLILIGLFCLMCWIAGWRMDRIEARIKSLEQTAETQNKK